MAIPLSRFSQARHQTSLVLNRKKALQGPHLAVGASEQALDVGGVQGAVASLERGHGGRPEVVRAARAAVNACQRVPHPQRRIQRLLQLPLLQCRSSLRHIQDSLLAQAISAVPGRLPK